MSEFSTNPGAARDSATDALKEAAGETYREVKDKAREVVSRTTDAARSQAMSQAETAKDALASTGERLARSLRDAVTTGDDSVQGRVMAAAADAVGELATSLRGRSFREALDDAQAFARRNPGAFVAAAAVAGFALARFARASASQAAPAVPAYGAGHAMGGATATGPGLGAPTPGTTFKG